MANVPVRGGWLGRISRGFDIQHIFVRLTRTRICLRPTISAANVPNMVQNACGMSAGDPDLWAKMMDLNLNTPMRLTARFAPGMVSRSILACVLHSHYLTAAPAAAAAANLLPAAHGKSSCQLRVYCEQVEQKEGIIINMGSVAAVEPMTKCVVLPHARVIQAVFHDMLLCGAVTANLRLTTMRLAPGAVLTPPRSMVSEAGACPATRTSGSTTSRSC